MHLNRAAIIFSVIILLHSSIVVKTTYGSNGHGDLFSQEAPIEVTSYFESERFTTIERSIDMMISIDANGDILPIGGSITPGFEGEQRASFVETFEIDGAIIDVDLDFRSRIVLDIDPRPYMIPGVIGEDDLKMHPEWKDGLENDIDPSWEHVEIGSKDGFGTHSIRIHPVYHGTDGMNWFYNQCLIKVRYEPNSISEIHSQISSRPIGSTKYLIITHEDLYESAVPLANWKSQKGIFTEIVTTEEIKDMYTTGDIQKKMRRYVSELESEGDLDYLLLLGDIDKVKTRNTRNEHPETAYGEGPTFATDGYFSCVDEGSTWNSDGDSSYAEGNELDDPIPDLAVGRLSLNDPDDISDLVQDLIERERNFSWNDKMDDAVFFAGDPGSVPGYPPTTLDHFWNTYASAHFDSHETIYYDGSGTRSFNSNSFIDMVGNSYQAICYFSHGTETGLPGLFSTSQIGSLSNNGPDGIMFAMACLTGKFDGSSRCFAEEITTRPDKGLVGFIGASRLAVGSIDTIYSGDAPGLEEDYWRYVVEAAKGNIPATIGDIYRNSITHFAQSFYPFPTSYYGYTPFRTYLEYNLFGEPEAPVFFSQPDQLLLEYDVGGNNTYVNARVLNLTSDPIANVSVTLFRADQLGVTALTDNEGYVNITIPPSNGGRINITAWRRGDLPANDTFTLPDLLPPEPMFSITPDEPDGMNDIYLTSPGIRLYSDEECTIDLEMDGVTNLTGENAPLDIKGEEGHHTIRFRAIDLVGHISDWLEFNYTLDTLGPNISVLTDPLIPDGSNGWFTNEPLLTLHSNEELSSSYYRIDDQAETTYNGPFELYEGVHSVVFRAVDKAGNQNMTSLHLKIDSTDPYSTIELSHQPEGMNGYYITRPSVVLKAFDENGAAAQYRWDNGNWTNYTGVIYPEKGVHSLDYRALDSTGNIEEPHNSIELRYDPDPPDIQVISTPGNPDGDHGYYISRPMVKIRSTVNSSEEIMDLSYALVEVGDGFDWENDSFEYTGPFRIPEGNWMLHALAVDPAGNRDYPPPRLYKVDLTIPEVEFHLDPGQPDGENNWYLTPPSVNITNVSQDARALYDFDNSSVWIEIDERIQLPSGTHTIRIMAVDTAGNNGTIHTFSYKCDITAPVAVVSAKSLTFFVNESFIIDAGSSSDDNSVLYYIFNHSDLTEGHTTNRSYWNISFTQPGNYTIWLTVIDPSGRTNRSVDLSIAIIERPSPPPKDDVDDGPIVPFDPDPGDSNDWTDPVEERERFWRGVIVIALILIICLLLILVVRKRNIQEVDWEEEDTWMDEDWVDIDLDEEPVEEDDVMIFE